MRVIQVVGAIAFFASLAGAISGCGSVGKDASQAQSPQSGRKDRPVAVDVVAVQTGALTEGIAYIGTTAPIREVSVRSRLEGRLIDLNVDVGDRVTVGQSVAELDNTVPSTAVLEAEAEVAALQSAVAQARAATNNARTQVQEARLRLRQAKADAERQQLLAREGAGTQQSAETAITQAQTNVQALQSAYEQVQVQEQTIASAQQRVLAQKAILARERERLSYTTIAAPINGVVMTRSTEPGNLLFAGNEILKLGDFSQVKAIVQVSELEITNIRLGQMAEVRLDAIPKRAFRGKVRRISPVADPVARLIPVEITIPNRDGAIGSGKLARVTFNNNDARNNTISIPESAVELASRFDRSDRAKGKQELSKNAKATLYVLEGEGDRSTVRSRQVTLGDRLDGKVAVLSGLKPGEQIVVQSGGKLRDGDLVRLSAISRSNSNAQNQTERNKRNP